MRALLALGLLCGSFLQPPPCEASSPVEPPREDWTIRTEATCAESRMSLLDARTLADGSHVAAGSSGGVLTIVRLPPAGGPPTRVSIETEGLVLLARLDPFGDVVAAWLEESVLCVRRYSGTSGRPLWPRAARVLEHQRGESDTVLLDPNGDVVILGARPEAWGLPMATKLRGPDGSILWGPVPLLGPTEGGTDGVRAARPDRSGRLLVLLADRVLGLNLQDGRRLWSAAVPPQAAGAIVAVGLDIFVTVGFGADLAAFRLLDGAPLWARRMPADIETAAELGVGNLLLVTAGSAGREVWKLSVASGRVVWGPVVSPVGITYGLQKGKRVVVDGNGDVTIGARFEHGSSILVKHDGRTGALLWSASSPASILPSALLSSPGGGSLIVGDGLTFRRHDAQGQLFESEATVSGAHGRFGLEPSARAVRGPGVSGVLVTSQKIGGLGYSSPGCAHRLVGWDPATGRVRWTLGDDASDEVLDLRSDPAGDVLYLAAHSPEGMGRVIKVDGGTGVTLWQSPELGTRVSSMAVDPLTGDVAVAFRGQPPSVTHLDGVTGSVRVGPVPIPIEASQLFFSAGLLLVVGHADGVPAVVGLDAFGLRSVWGPLFDPGEPGKPPRAALDQSGRLHLAIGRKGLEAGYLVVDATTGAPLVTASVPVVGSPREVILDGRGSALLLTGSPQVAITSVDSRSGIRRWGPIAFPGALEPTRVDATGPDVLVFTTRPWGAPAQLLALDPDSGDVRWSRELSGARAAGMSERGEPLGASLAAAILRGDDPADDFHLLEDLSDSIRLRRMTAGLSLRAPRVRPVPCGVPLREPFEVQGGAGPYRFELVSGSLPEGLSVSEDGFLEGATRAAGPHEVTLRVRDSDGRELERDLFVDVVASAPDTALEGGVLELCRGVPALLVAPADLVTLDWIPFGETTTHVTVVPDEPTLVVVDGVDAGGCPRRASVRIEVVDPEDPPLVLGPPGLSLLQNVCQDRAPGAVGKRSAELASFLQGGLARSVCTPVLGRLDVREGDDVVGPDTFLTIGLHQLDFSFEDQAGRVGVGTSGVDVLLAGDASGNARIDELDPLYLAHFLVSGRLQAGVDIRQLDVNIDSRVDVFDLVLVNNHLVGNIACLTP